MAAGAQAGYLGKVTVPADGEKSVLEMANWVISGMETDMLEDTQFTETFKSYIPGQGDGGIVTVSGNYNPEDDLTTEGQGYLMDAWINKTAVATPKFYFNDTEYFELTGGGTAWCQSIDDLGTDQTGLCKLTFVIRISGGYLAKA